LNNGISRILLAIPFFLPVAWRLLQDGLIQPIGILSDLVFGLLALLLVLFSPFWIRVTLIIAWTLFQTLAHELFSAMQRLPCWQDVYDLLDPTFVKNSLAGFHLNSPYLTGVMLFSAMLACWVPLRRPAAGSFFKGLALGLSLFMIHGFLSQQHSDLSISARYNPLQWFITDALSMPFQEETELLPMDELPLGLRQVDLQGEPLVRKGIAKNVLIVVMEGIPGLYYPAIREAMGWGTGFTEMKGFAENTAGAMLIPDFVTHSHQTIRGLYSILCGDVSELSFKTPKAFELLENPEQASQCLPARMAENGWNTHYLQGAGLTFMGKDLVMPAVGFQEVHGKEWFAEPDEYPFEWGVSDSAFFRGARKYIAGLQAAQHPWMMTLLTVGTHQPYSAPDDIAARYPSRKDASVALLDQAVAEFIRALKQDGVLNDTLVIFTSDESHGHPLAEWVSSWGMGVLLAPEHEKLPRIKQGTFGLMDMTVSVLDYFGLDMPASIIGRSFFRDYTKPREMVAYTGGKLRWHTSQDLRYECTPKDGCLVGRAPSILGFPPDGFVVDNEDHGARFFASAAALDNKLNTGRETRLMKFANGEIRKLPEKIGNEWSDNLVGAQYLDFPAESKVHVSILVKAVQAQVDGIQLRLTLRQWEQKVGDISFSGFPLLHTGEETRIEFDFDNPQKRQAFSFHLTGEGHDSSIQIKEFNVMVM